MALTVTVNRKSSDLKEIRLYCRITASGSYASPDPLDFRGLPGWTAKDPVQVEITGKAGYIYKYDYANRGMRAFIPTAVSGNSPFAEHSVAAYNAALSGDVIDAVVTYSK